MLCDALAERGDARGQLGLLQSRLSEGAAEEVREEETRLRTGSLDALLGKRLSKRSLAHLVPGARRRPFVTQPVPDVELEWRFGFVVGAKVSGDALEDDGKQLVAELLDAPACVLLQRLELMPCAAKWEALAGLLTAHTREALEVLRLGHVESSWKWDAAMLGALPRLRELEVRTAEPIDLSRAKHRSLEALHLCCVTIDLPAKGRFPALRHAFFEETVAPFPGGKALIAGNLLPGLKSIGMAPSLGGRVELLAKVAARLKLEAVGALSRVPETFAGSAFAPGGKLEHVRFLPAHGADVVELYNFGLFLRDEWGRAADALAYFHRADELSPGDTDVLLELGNAYSDLRRFDEAEQCWRELVRIDPESDGWHNLAYLGLHTGKLEQALADEERAVKLSRDETTLHQRGEIRLRLGDAGGLEDLRAAEKLFTKLIRAKDDEAENLLWRGATRVRLGRQKQGLADIERALELKPVLRRQLADPEFEMVREHFER